MKKLLFAALLLSTAAQADLYCRSPGHANPSPLCTDRYGHNPSLMYEKYEHLVNHLTAIGYPLPVKLEGWWPVDLPGLNYVEDVFGGLHNR